MLSPSHTVHTPTGARQRISCTETTWLFSASVTAVITLIYSSSK